jgi:hypothetical protein
LLALALLEIAAIALLGLLVAGLLRSHAEILRLLHHLGADLDLPGAAPGSAPRADLPVVDLTQPGALGPVTGESPEGDAVAIALDRPGQQTLLLFLSSGCGTCAPWWDGLRSGVAARALPGVRVVVVARDAAEESPALLSGLAPPDAVVVLSSPAWETFAVPGSPYAVLVDGATASVMGQGVARTWEQLASLVGQHMADTTTDRRGAARERRADARLLAAGIRPGHPSLYPPTGSSTPERPG